MLIVYTFGIIHIVLKIHISVDWFLAIFTKSFFYQHPVQEYVIIFDHFQTRFRSNYNLRSVLSVMKVSDKL